MVLWGWVLLCVSGEAMVVMLAMCGSGDEGDGVGKADAGAEGRVGDIFSSITDIWLSSLRDSGEASVVALDVLKKAF